MITVCEDCGIPFTGTDRVDMIDGEFPRKYRHVECPVADAEKEAAERYPLWDTPSTDQERHRAGYWGFIAGVEWARRLT